MTGVQPDREPVEQRATTGRSEPGSSSYRTQRSYENKTRTEMNSQCRTSAQTDLLPDAKHAGVILQTH